MEKKAYEKAENVISHQKIQFKILKQLHYILLKYLN